MIITEMRKQGRVYIKHNYYINPQQSGKKAFRAEEVHTQIVEVDGISFNADELSMDRIDRIIDLANWKFNKAVASGVAQVDAYQIVYNTVVPWKTADNRLVEITVETLCKVQDAAVHKLGEIWIKYG